MHILPEHIRSVTAVATKHRLHCLKTYYFNIYFNTP